MTLSSGTADVKEMPRYRLSVNINVEDMFSDAHRLDTGMQDVIYCTSANNGIKSIHLSLTCRRDIFSSGDAGNII